MRSRSAVASAVLTAFAIGAGSASAATLDTAYPCYSSGESLMLTGSGFTPSGPVALSLSGQQLATVVADSEGGFGVRVEAPLGPFGPTALRFTATDGALPTRRAARTIRIADTDVLVTPAIGGPSRLRRIRASGFLGAEAIYLHVKRRGSKRVHTVRLGKPRGACGVLDVRRRLFARGVRPGSYLLQFDALRRYYRGLASSVVYDVRIFGSSNARKASGRRG